MLYTRNQIVLLRTRELLQRVLASQRLAHRPKRLLIHQLHRTPAGCVLCPTAAVVRSFAGPRVTRVPGVQRAVGTTNDVDEMHASIVASDPQVRYAALGLRLAGYRRVRCADPGLHPT